MLFFSVKFCDPGNNSVVEETDFKKKERSQKYTQSQKRQ